MSSKSVSIEIKKYAGSLGFDLVGITNISPSRRISSYEDWLEKGFAAGMAYLKKNIDKRRNPSLIFPEARSIITLGLNYYQGNKEGSSGLVPHLSRYAWGIDYHLMLRDRLGKLAGLIKSIKKDLSLRIFVDSAPIIEREIAEAGGIGWYGKNNSLYSPEVGSWFFLGEIFLDLELEPDEPLRNDCGNCRLCIDSCPTGAIKAPHLIDANYCISYLTIENRGSIPLDLRDSIGDRLFGCDRCQEVCPWNNRASSTPVEEFYPGAEISQLDIPSLFELNESDFKKVFAKSPILRAKRGGLLRNAAVVLGNSKDEKSMPALLKGLQDSDPIVRGHAAWAIEKLKER